MRAVRKLSITFGGGFNVACRLYSVAENNDVEFNLYHVHEGGAAFRVKEPYVCEDEQCRKTNPVLGYGDISKGTEVAGEDSDVKLALFSPDELKQLQSECSGGDAIEVIELMPTTQIPRIYYDSPMFLEPENDRDVKGFCQLRQMLAEHDCVATVVFMWFSKLRLGVVQVEDKNLMLWTIRWPEDLRDGAGFKAVDKTAVLSEREQAMADMLYESWTVEKFDPESDAYRNAYRARLNAAVTTRAAAGFGATDDVSDLQAALEKSIKARELAAAKERHPSSRRKTA